MARDYAPNEEPVPHAVARPWTVPPEMAGTTWGQLVSAMPTGKPARKYKGGTMPPSADQLSPQMVGRLRSSYGITDRLGEKDVKALMALKWTYGQPAPKGFEYDDNGVLKKKGNGWITALKVAGLGAATIATAGALTPVTGPALAAVLAGGAVGAAVGAKRGGWKGALIGGATGAASGAISGGGLSGLSGGGQAAGRLTSQQMLRQMGTNAAIGAGQGVLQGGGWKGALTGAASGAAGVATGGGMPNSTLTNTLINAGTGAFTGYLQNGKQGAIAGAAGGAISGATAGSKNPNVQLAGRAGSTLAQKLLSGTQAAGSAMSSAAAAREAGRATEAGNIVTQDNQRLQALTAAENARQGRSGLELRQREDSRAAEAQALSQALRTALALNTRDVSMTRPAGVTNMSFTGGSRPSALGVEGRRAAQIANERAMERLLNPEAYAELPPLEEFTPKDLPKPTAADTALGVGGAIANAVGAYQTSQQATQQSTLINELLRRSQQDAAQGLTQPVVVPASPHSQPATLQNTPGASGLFIPPAQRPIDEESINPAIFGGVRF